SPYSSPHLMQITHTEHVSTVDHNCIRIWDVETRVNNVGRNQHIVFVMNKIHHDFAQFFAIHLTMSAHYPCISHSSHDQVGNRSYLSNTVVYKEDLTSTPPFIRNSVPHHLAIERL